MPLPGPTSKTCRWVHHRPQHLVAAYTRGPALRPGAARTSLADALNSRLRQRLERHTRHVT